METNALARAIGQWFQKHKDENPFAFGEIHLITEEEEAEILLIIGKPEEECRDHTTFARQWEGTLYDAPVTWIWQQLADENADEWLRIIYDREARAMKGQMLSALLELFRLIEGNGFTMDWETDETDDEPWRVRLHIDPTDEKITFETDRWQALLNKHRTE
ncbi:MAG: hypothetical protein G8237_11250 [Magnetococcales bacterium]|nr:hypothetical protein [Magnetococcales bacterium]NGZ06920.1 hypothetical protein [Magnetococcales bacterium]